MGKSLHGVNPGILSSPQVYNDFQFVLLRPEHILPTDGASFIDSIVKT
jgi:hypothetical protein